MARGAQPVVNKGYLYYFRMVLSDMREIDMEQTRRFRLKQQFASIGDDFRVFNERGELCCTIDGASDSFGRKLSLLDSSGERLALIEQRLFAKSPTYVIEPVEGQQVVVTQHRFSWRPRFSVTGVEPTLEIIGNFSQNRYEFRRSKAIIARVIKESDPLVDSYVVEIYGNEDWILVVSIGLVVDMVLHNRPGGRG